MDRQLRAPRESGEAWPGPRRRERWYPLSAAPLHRENFLCVASACLDEWWGRLAWVVISRLLVGCQALRDGFPRADWSVEILSAASDFRGKRFPNKVGRSSNTVGNGEFSGGAIYEAFFRHHFGFS